MAILKFPSALACVPNLKLEDPLPGTLNQLVEETPVPTINFCANKFVLVVFVPVALVQRRPDKFKGFEMERLVKLPVVANKLVEVTFVEVTFPTTKLPILLVLAFRVVPEAVVKAKVVMVAFVANKLVLVVFVPVALVQTRPERVRGFETVRLVKLPFVEKRLVEVTEVAVALVKVRACRAEAPETERELETVKPAVEVPPANWIALVVVFPALVTACRVLLAVVPREVQFAVTPL